MSKRAKGFLVLLAGAILGIGLLGPQPAVAWHRSPHGHAHHHGLHLDVWLGAPPHRHFVHRHHPRCVVVVEKHVYVPRWHVHHIVHRHPRAVLHLELFFPLDALYVDGASVGPLPHHGPLRLAVAPGRHVVRLQVNGRAYERVVQVPAGTTVVVRVQR
ncbi:MAG: hypothetical protein KatS3mg131_3864 [Candidatus Tectimicrobiota bacterium]|nr:MAG: hypothetical protein KatS3mg131_3864 [Candidatus Tectomicrobia bacterium]